MKPYTQSVSNHEILLSQVDKHIRRLDADLARFENELKEKLEVSGYESTEGRGLKSKLGFHHKTLQNRCMHVYTCKYF